MALDTVALQTLRSFFRRQTPEDVITSEYVDQYIGNEFLDNSPLSDMNAELFSRNVLDPAKQLLALTDDALSLCRAISAPIEREQKLLQDLVSRCRGVVSPLRRIPAELLIEIFNCAFDKYHVLDISEGPWLLSHVCRRWRHIIFSNSAYWSDIDVNIYHDTFETLLISHRRRVITPSSTIVNLLRTALELGGTSRLKITCSIRIEDPLPGTHDALSHTVGPWLKELVKYTERWQSASLIMDAGALEESDVLLEELTQAAGCLGRLETLVLGLGRYRAGMRWPESLSTTFEVAPKLKHVKLIDVGCPIKLPLAQLNTLSFASATSHARHDLAPPSLSSFLYLSGLNTLCCVVDGFTMPDITVSPSYICNDTLSVLHVSDYQILRFATLRSLEELRVKAADFATCDPESIPCPSQMLGFMRDFLERSQPPLHTLEIADVQDVDRLVEVLLLTPRLEHLAIQYIRWDFDVDNTLTRLFQHLTGVQDRANPVVPILRTFTLTIHEATLEPDDEFEVYFIDRGLLLFLWNRRGARARANGVADLEKLEVHFHFKVPVSTMSCVKHIGELKEDGLDVFFGMHVSVATLSKVEVEEYQAAGVLIGI